MGRIETPATKKDVIYETLRRAIISGEIQPGAILNEADTAQKYDTGKTPTREALLLLSHENFLSPLPRVGYMVTSLTVQDILEIFALRQILEVEAVGLAAERMDPATLQELEDNNRRETGLSVGLSGGLPGSDLHEQARRLNREFHLAIARASGSRRLARMVQELVDDLERSLSTDPYIADPAQHVEIIRCLRAGERAAARDAMRRHIDETLDRLVHPHAA